MGLIKKIKKWYFKNHRKLTPKGECLRIYLDRIINGSDEHIAAYDEVVYSIIKNMKHMYNIDIDYKDAVELMSTYFTEYYS